jgi:hypothetical protein
MPLTCSVQRLLFAVLASLLTAATMLATPNLAQAAVNSPTGLTPTGTSLSGTPALQWSRVAGAQRYEVELSASSDFSTPLYSVKTYNRRAVPTVDLPARTFYWRVRSVSATSAVSTWSAASFTVTATAGPSLQSPVDEAVLTQPSSDPPVPEPPVLSWDVVPGALSYEVQIDQAPGAAIDADFIGPATVTTRNSSYLVQTPQPATFYSWRVRAQRSGGAVTDWSEIRNYEIPGLDLVKINAPVNSPETQVEDVVFDWAPVPGAKDYEIRVSNDENFTTLSDQKVVKSTRYSPTTTYDNDQYWWQVRARDNQGNTRPWSETIPAGSNAPQFQRHWPDQVQLVYPADFAGAVTSDPFYFQWAPVDHASRYQLEMGTDQNFSPGTFESCLTKASTYTPGASGVGQLTGCVPNPGTTYYWRVRGLDDPKGINGIWSEIRGFVYEPGRVNLLSPQPGESVSIPTFRWAAAQDAEKYRVSVRNGSGTVVASTDTYSLSWTPTTKLVAGTYRWSVVSIDRNGDVSPAPLLGSQATFTVDGTIPTTGADPLTPLAPTTEAPRPRFPALRWEPFDGATSYKVYVRPPNGTTYRQLTNSSGSALSFYYPAATDAGATNLLAGEYHWFVEAYGSGGYLGQGPDGAFTVADLAEVTGQRLALSGRDLDPSVNHMCDNRLDAPTGPQFCEDLKQTPVLDWAPVPEASHYLVYLFKDRELTTPVYKTTPAYVTTQNTRWTPTELLPDSQAGDAYYWFVRPCKSASICAPDPTSAKHAFDKASNPVELESPADSLAPAAVANQLTLKWRDNLETNQTKDVAHRDASGGQPTVEAKSYNVEIATDDTFTTVLHKATVDQTTYTPYGVTLPEGSLWWRVQAVDGSGNPLAWSTPRQVTKSSPVPAPTAPADQTFVDGTPFLRWTALPFAASYEVEIYRNGDDKLSSANRVYLGSSPITKQAAFTPSVQLPASTLPYFWRVRRLDADGRPGAWSEPTSFRVRGPAPGQLSPAAGSYVKANESYFTWETVQAAASYVFERRVSGSTTSSEKTITYTQSYAPSVLLIDSTWEWRVTSRDASGQTLASSPWRTFKVDSATPTVTSKSPTTSRVPRDVNFKVSFSETVRHLSTMTMRLYQSGKADPVSARIASSNGGRTWTLNPARLLTSGKRYTLKLSSGITDKAGNALAATSWTVTSR